ncbi:hypothetical protein BDW22DRAFT_1350728 [Trametopsis cervina]|nr:hypothetical protein BDW22DRAFT_1350728 [Trametopsis cervina]
MLVGVYGRFVRNPRWPVNRTVGICSGANVFGFLFGQVKRASAHQHFFNSLENKEGFLTALRDMAGEGPVPLPANPTSVYPLADKPEQRNTAPSNNEDAIESTWATTDQNPNNPSPVVPTRPSPAPSPIGENPRVSSRWDQIRAANAKGGKTSTWDALRQGHERNQTSNSDNLHPTQVPTATNSADAERMREQAQFDAMLEAERQQAGRS